MTWPILLSLKQSCVNLLGVNRASFTIGASSKPSPEQRRDHLERGGAVLSKFADAASETVEITTEFFEGEGEREDAFQRLVRQGVGYALAP